MSQSTGFSYEAESGQNNGNNKRSAGDGGLDQVGPATPATKRLRVPRVNWVTRRAPRNGLQWQNTKTREWVKAIRHDSIRHLLLRDASPGEAFTYVQAWDEGANRYDKTAYHHPSQGSFKERAYWHTIVESVLNILEEGGYAGQ